MRIVRHAEELIIPISQAEAERLDVREGDEVAVEKVSPSSQRKALRKIAALEALDGVRISLPPDWRFDRDEANAR